jgi:hypothetical protein
VIDPVETVPSTLSETSATPLAVPLGKKEVDLLRRDIEERRRPRNAARITH